MKRLNATNVIRAAVLTSLATLMVAGFLVMGGLGSGGSAEAQCARSWFSRCASPLTVGTTEVTSVGATTSTFTSAAPITFTETLTFASTTFLTLTTDTLTGTITSTSVFTTTFTSTSVGIDCSRQWFSRCLR